MIRSIIFTQFLWIFYVPLYFFEFNFNKNQNEVKYFDTNLTNNLLLLNLKIVIIKQAF